MLSKWWGISRRNQSFASLRQAGLKSRKLKVPTSISWKITVTHKPTLTNKHHHDKMCLRLDILAKQHYKVVIIPSVTSNAPTWYDLICVERDVKPNTKKSRSSSTNPACLMHKSNINNRDTSKGTQLRSTLPYLHYCLNKKYIVLQIHNKLINQQIAEVDTLFCSILKAQLNIILYT